MNKWFIGKLIALVLGLAMLAGAWFSYQSASEFVSIAVPAQGTVVDFFESRSSDSLTYRPIVRFVTESGESIEFTSPSGSSPPSYSQGEAVDVLYDPELPGNAQINSFFSLWGVSIIFLSMGFILTLIGVTFFIRQRSQARTRDILRTTGTPVQTQFSSTEKNRSIKADGRYPYRIFSQWTNPTTHKLHIFESENIWYNPESHIKDNQITVFIDPANPKKYHMDLSFLPEVAG